MTDYIILTVAALFIAGDFAINKLYQKRSGTSLRAGFLFNALLGLFTAIIFFVANGFKLNFSIFSAVMALALTAFTVTYNLLGFRILKSGSMAMYTLFLMSGGTIIPYVWGMLFLDERPSFLRSLGLVFIIGAVIVSNISKKSFNKKQLIMCIAVFVLNGCVSVISKLHQIDVTYGAVSSTDFVILSGISKFILAGAVYLVILFKERKKNNKIEGSQRAHTVSLNKWVIPLLIVSSAVVNGVGYFLQLIGAEQLPATLLYPFITGGGMIFSTFIGILLFKEKPTKQLLCGIVLCFIGTLLLI